MLEKSALYLFPFGTWQCTTMTQSIQNSCSVNFSQICKGYLGYMNTSYVYSRYILFLFCLPSVNSFQYVQICQFILPLFFIYVLIKTACCEINVLPIDSTSHFSFKIDKLSHSSRVTWFGNEICYYYLTHPNLERKQCNHGSRPYLENIFIPLLIWT